VFDDLSPRFHGQIGAEEIVVELTAPQRSCGADCE